MWFYGVDGGGNISRPAKYIFVKRNSYSILTKSNLVITRSPIPSKNVKKLANAVGQASYVTCGPSVLRSR